MKKSLIILSFLLIMALAIPVNYSFAQGKTKIEYIALAKSRIWIDGSSTINDFSCSSDKIKGFGYLRPTQNTPKQIQASDSSVVDITVTVKSFDCGVEGMNNDMHNALKYERYPLIKYRLVDADVLSKKDSLSAAKFTLNTKGELSIAGVTNTVNILMQVDKLNDGTYHLVGHKPLSMYDFDITPPSAFFGLIKAHDKLTVYFDLYARAERIADSNIGSDSLAVYEAR